MRINCCKWFRKIIKKLYKVSLRKWHYPTIPVKRYSPCRERKKLRQTPTIPRLSQFLLMLPAWLIRGFPFAPSPSLSIHPAVAKPPLVVYKPAVWPRRHACLFVYCQPPLKLRLTFFCGACIAALRVPLSLHTPGLRAPRHWPGQKNKPRKACTHTKVCFFVPLTAGWPTRPIRAEYSKRCVKID